MAELNLSKYGITGTTEVVHNPSYDLLFEEETKSTNEGYEKGQVSELGAVNVMTGIYTGRSPKDKYIVMDENSKNTVWWTSEGYKNDNHPMTESTWASVKDLAIKELSNKKLYVVDAFCGANKDTRMALQVKGSGYTFLVIDKNNNLRIINTSNQDTPYYYGFTPIMTIDVWEHSYYLKYNNKRKDYLEDIFNIIDYDKVYNLYLSNTSPSL